MSTYVMSDLHGHYQAYRDMLEKIDFAETDRLYILGDVLDRGPRPISILLDAMERSNITIIAGNHCVMAVECLRFLMQEITEDSVSGINEEMVEKLLTWQYNGSVSTTDEFHRCGRKTQKEILNFISNFDLYEEIEVGGRTYVMVHAGLGNFRPDKELWEYELDELVWHRMDYEEQYFEDKFVITGHTPTMAIEGNPRPGYIYQANHNIAIDCGLSFPGGRLGCLRLDDMQEFYVEAED